MILRSIYRNRIVFTHRELSDYSAGVLPRIECLGLQILTVFTSTDHIIGSAEALPILCVSDFCESQRERERDACDVIDITLKSRVIMHMITSTARPNASTRSDSEPVERSNFEVHVKTGAWRLSARLSSRVE